MTDFDPGPGWREVERSEAATHAEVVSYRAPRGDAPRVRTWVREDPVPPLPTEPCTVIRVTFREGEHRRAEYALGRDGLWYRLGGGSYSAGGLASSITGFEVLAEPVDTPLDADWYQQHIEPVKEQVRRETAKAVLDRIASQPWAREVDLTRWRREFGVTPGNK